MRASRLHLVFAVVAPMLGCAEGHNATVPTAPQAVEVETIEVQPGSWVHTFKSYGMVTPEEEYEIGVEISSTVNEVLFREGQQVQAGDVLLRLDDKKLRLKLDGDRATVEEARADFEQARSTHERNESIFESGVISEQAFLQSEARFKASKRPSSGPLSI